MDNNNKKPLQGFLNKKHPIGCFLITALVCIRDKQRILRNTLYLRHASLLANWAGFLMWKCIISEHFTAKITVFVVVHVFVIKPQKRPVCISHVFKFVVYQCQYLIKNSVCLHAICLCVKFAFIVMHAEQIYIEFNDWNWLGYNDQCTNLLIKTQTYYWFPHKCSLVTHTANHDTRMKAGLEFCSSCHEYFAFIV